MMVQGVSTGLTQLGHPTFDELLAALAKPTPKPPSMGKALGTYRMLLKMEFVRNKLGGNILLMEEIRLTTWDGAKTW